MRNLKKSNRGGIPLTAAIKPLCNRQGQRQQNHNMKLFIYRNRITKLLFQICIFKRQTCISNSLCHMFIELYISKNRQCFSDLILF